MKKIIAIALALMLCVGVLSVSAFAAEGDMVIHIQAHESWSACYAYNWNPESLGGWPGSELTADADGLYTLEVAPGFEGMVISAGNGQPQTTDIKDLDMTKTEAWIVVGDTGADGKHTYTISYTDPNGGNTGDDTTGGDDTTTGGDDTTTGGDDTTTGGDNTVEIDPDAVYTVAGFAGLCGSEWNEKDTNNDMTVNSDGTYTKTYSNVAAGEYEFKIVKNHSWDNDDWGKDGLKSDNVKITVAAGDTVTIKFNPATGKISVSGAKSNVPATGDMGMTAIFVVLAVACCGVVALVCTKKKFF